MTMENLNEFQNARAEALLVARNNLDGKAPLGGARVLAVNDLVDLAEWILTGRHPLERYAADPDAVEVSEAGLALVSDAPKEPTADGHQRLTSLLSMSAGHSAGAGCSCGWHSHLRAWEDHIADMRNGDA